MHSQVAGSGDLTDDVTGVIDAARDDAAWAPRANAANQVPLRVLDPPRVRAADHRAGKPLISWRCVERDPCRPLIGAAHDPIGQFVSCHWTDNGLDQMALGNIIPAAHFRYRYVENELPETRRESGHLGIE